jgi:transglutaminase-like putative cysteine protease
MTRRPAALVAPPLARLAGYVLLAGLGAFEWARYIDGTSAARPLGWVAAGTATAAGLMLAARARRFAVPALIAATLGGLILALAASGLDFHFLKPRHWDELGDGIARGAESLNTVRLPYVGKEQWVLTTVELAGALLCWLAAVLAAWPQAGRSARIGALCLLLTLAASPVVSVGVERPVLLGLALAILVAAFLWLERLSRRPGLSLAVVAGAVLLVAVPIGQAADREDPWFDYKAFSEKLGGGPPVTFEWDHDYGPIDWPREGAELFRVRSNDPHYWKAETLSYFDGIQWSSSLRADPGGDEPRDDLPRTGKQHPDWNTTFSVSLRRLETAQVIGAGTTLDVTDATDDVVPGVVPGEWIAEGGDELSKGDSYTVRARIAEPTPEELEDATVGGDPRRYGSLGIHVNLAPGNNIAPEDAPLDLADNPIPLTQADIQFAPFESEVPPLAAFAQYGTTGRGNPTLQASLYDRTWALSKRLRRQSDSAYDYVLAVNDYLNGPGFVYTESPPPVGDEAPLEGFLFDTRAGYCQQYSGAMTLLLRMGGIPARVATGFSPGGVRTGTNDWVVRDTDAHSWVEAWFDGIGWVTFDPTPADTPARSQIAAIAQADASLGGGGLGGDLPGGSAFERPGQLLGPGGAAGSGALDGLGGAKADGGVSVGLWFLLALAIAGLGVLLALVVRGLQVQTPETALEELERALRRSGRSAPAGTTLTQLEQRLGVSRDGYLRELRRARYGPAGTVPDSTSRAAFRRDLASGLGFGGQLRALWALPPHINLPKRQPR